MNFADLTVADAESLAVDERLDCRQLVEHDKVIVLDVVVDGVQVGHEQPLLERVLPSL